jgi:hypothetical protein
MHLRAKQGPNPSCQVLTVGLPDTLWELTTIPSNGLMACAVLAMLIVPLQFAAGGFGRLHMF